MWPSTILAPPAQLPLDRVECIEDEPNAGYDEQDESDELDENELDFGYRG